MSLSKTFGEYGAVVVRTASVATSAPSGNYFFAIQVVADTVFSALAVSSGLTGDSLTGVSIPAGNILYGNFTSFTLTSGFVIAYKAKP